MPCFDSRPAGMTEEQRQRQIDEALQRLEQQMARGTVTVSIGPQGAVAFDGWAEAERDGVADVCAYRALKVAGSFELAQAVQRAEMASGRSVDEQQVAAGIHSHDGGATWHPGH